MTAVLGAGSWGTALAIHCARAGHVVRLWAHASEHARIMQASRRNPRYLAEIELPETVEATADLPHALGGADLVICAVPSHAMRSCIAQVHDAMSELGRLHADASPTYLVAAKGVELETLVTMEQVLRAQLPVAHRDRVAVLGGPSFAAEVAQDLPTTVVVASRHWSVAVDAQRSISARWLRAYVTDDVIGVELGGALKNVIALAAGVCDGAGLGQNARAGLITRGLAEMSRLAIACGAHSGTLAGLAGLGDLVLTCTGQLSRNRTLGIALGRGHRLEDALRELGMVAEGVNTTRAAAQLALREAIEMPIVAAMHAVLYDDWSVRDAVDALMGRALKAERE